MTTASSSLTGHITPLSRPASTTLRSALIIPTYPSVLRELVQNSLDAESTTVNIFADFTTGDKRVRVEDDGVGIRGVDLGRIGGRYESSKHFGSRGVGSAGSYGFRGEGQPLRTEGHQEADGSFIVHCGFGSGGCHNEGEGVETDLVKGYKGDYCDRYDLRPPAHDSRRQYSSDGR
jgi:hypothetical protein